MIEIEQQPWQQMVEHARSTYPNECCGAMLGKIEDGHKRVVVAMALENASAGPQAARYELRPEDLLAADREARRHNLDLVGIYHSHPNAPARPSDFDKAHAWPSLSYVVMEVRDGKTVETKSWILKDDRTEFVPERIVME